MDDSLAFIGELDAAMGDVVAVIGNSWVLVIPDEPSEV